MTSKLEIKQMAERGIELGMTHMIVVCDTFDHSDYPVFVTWEGDAKKEAEIIDNKPMQKVMEVYNLSLPLEPQLNCERVFNY